MGLITAMKEARFWEGWKDRFEGSKDRYITPDNPTVVRAAEAADKGATSPEEIALNVWQYIYDNTKYKLSKEWKEPAQTLRDGIGDCEDVTFLAASMLPNMGVRNFKVVIGELIFPSGAKELHTWVEVGDMVIDPTGSPGTSPQIEYRPVQTYRINAQ